MTTTSPAAWPADTRVTPMEGTSQVILRNERCLADESLLVIDPPRDMLAGNLQQFRRGRMSARERAYAAMLDKLRGMESEQREIARRTGRVIKSYHRRAAKLMKHRINPFVRRSYRSLSGWSARRRETFHFSMLSLRLTTAPNW